MTGTARHQLRNRLPRGYNDDAQDHTLSGPTTGQSPRVLDVHGDQYRQADACSAGLHFTSPSMDNRVHGTGVPGAARETDRTEGAHPAGDTLPAGLDTTQEFGVNEVAGGGVRSHAAGNPEIAQQLRASRILRL